MRLFRFGEKGKELPGVQVDSIRYDCSDTFEDWNRSFFTNSGLERLEKKIKECLSDFKKISDDVRLGSPVSRPGMILCVGLNYKDHAEESNMDIPTEPILFMKATNTLAGPYDPVTIPKDSSKTDWEVELGIVMGEDISYAANLVSAEQAIAGYCIINDLSERAFQLEKGGQWVKGKSCPGFTPVGPYLITKDEIPNVLSLDMRLYVNGKLMQDGNTSTMIFDPAYIVHYVSQFMKLEAGDIISTGTPPGVGLGMSPPTYIKAGDVVRLEIESLGYQKQTMIPFDTSEE